MPYRQQFFPHAAKQVLLQFERRPRRNCLRQHWHIKHWMHSQHWHIKLHCIFQFTLLLRLNLRLLEFQLSQWRMHGCWMPTWYTICLKRHLTLNYLSFMCSFVFLFDLNAFNHAIYVFCRMLTVSYLHCNAFCSTTRIRHYCNSSSVSPMLAMSSTQSLSSTCPFREKTRTFH